MFTVGQGVFTVGQEVFSPNYRKGVVTCIDEEALFIRCKLRSMMVR